VTDASSRSTRADVGQAAESRAAAYLAAQGLAIVTRNFRTRRGEIDLIARDGAVLVFVEVRRRRSSAYGGAAASITEAKRARIVAAAAAYLATLAHEPACRFDVVLIDGDDPRRVDWRQDVIAVE